MTETALIDAGVEIPKPVRMTQAQRTELSDQRMFDAAAELILEVGTERTTLKDVGERAGYSRGLASARFGSKQSLFVALADRCRRVWIDELSTAAKNKSGLALLLSRIDAITTFAEQQPLQARVMYVLWFESVGAPSDINESLARFHKQARTDICEIVFSSEMFVGRGARKNAERFAARFCGTVFGLCYQWLVNPNAIDIRANMNDIKKELEAQYK
ncbi:MAG: helix-turn-helix domain-containing protein [Pseudomonadota bacterium]